MTDKIVDGVFAIALVALILLNAEKVKDVILGGAGAYGKTVAGLQGRRVTYP